MAMKKKFFISYIHEEEELAKFVRDSFSYLFSEYAEFFLSSGGILTGENWLKKIKEEIKAGESIMVILSKRSINRSWVNIEFGAFWAYDKHILPLCHADLNTSELKRPISDYQATHLYKQSSVKDLIGVIANRCGLNALPVFDMSNFCKKVKEIDGSIFKVISEWEQVLNEINLEGIKELPLDLSDFDIKNESVLTNTNVYDNKILEIGGYVKDAAVISLRNSRGLLNKNFLIINVNNSEASISSNLEKLLKIKINDDVCLSFVKSHRHYDDKEYIYQSNGYYIYDLKNVPNRDNIHIQLIFWKISIDRLRLKFFII